MKKIFDKIYIASDHAGFDLKNKIILYLKKKNNLILDLGPFLKKSVDYPDFAKKVSIKVKQKKTNSGILVCGSGTGMAISANKLKGIRAAVCYNAKSTRLSRQHNNANIIALGSRLTNKKEVFKLIQIFIKTQFEGGRHLRRVKKI